MVSVAILTASLLAVLGADSSAPGLAAEFSVPIPGYSPVPIWWWSGDPVEQERISEQLERLAQGGIYNAIILNLAPSGPLYGSAADEPPFLSEQWWDIFGHAVKEARRLGVRLWFYDQLGFSGAGLQARVVRDHPEFRGVELRREFKDIEGPGEVELRTPVQGEPLAAFITRLSKKKTPEAATPEWIWDTAAPAGACKRYFRRNFTLDRLPVKAVLNITADNGYVAYVNGVKLGEESIYGSEGWGQAEHFDLLPHLRVGTNTVAFEGENLGGVGGLLAEILVEDNEKSKKIFSDKEFRISAEAPEGWLQPEFDDSAWAPPGIIGKYPCGPWNEVLGIASAGEITLGVGIQNIIPVTETIEEGVLRINVPQGPHRVMLFYTVPGGFDYQNPEAGAALLDIVHGQMECRFSEELGGVIAGSFQDEFPALPRFSKRMIEKFPLLAGYDLIPKLPALYDDVTDRFSDPKGPTTVQVRCDASQVAAQLCEEAFFIPLHDWHERYGMLCGYDQTVRNADPLRGEQYYVDYFKTMRHYSVPGNDMDGDAKPHESIADLYQRPRVWIEAFHSSGWGQTLEEIAVLMHPWLVNGATLFNPHAIYYSIHGSYWEWAPPDTGWRQPYYVHYPVFAEYVSRLCYVLSQGTHDVQVAVLHPSTTVHAYMGFGEPSRAAREAQDMYWGVQRALQKERLDYVILDEDSLQPAAIRNGGVSAGSLCLKVIILPSVRVLQNRSIDKLGHFVLAGGKIILAGAALEHFTDVRLSPELYEKAVKQILSDSIRSASPEEAVSAALASVPRFVAEPVQALKRHTAERDFFFVLSDGETPANGQARFAINQRKLYETTAAKGARMPVTFLQDAVPEYWDALSGQVVPLYNYQRTPQGETGGQTRVELELANTPAPLIGLRTPVPEDPVAVVSDLEITGYERRGDVLEVRGYPRLDQTASPTAEHTIKVEFSDGTFEGRTSSAPLAVTPIEGPLAFRLEPTCNNEDGSFAWPPSEGPIPVETRSFRYHEEKAGDDSSAWMQPEFDDTSWESVLASFGPRAEWTGPLGQKWEEITGAPAEPGEFHPAVYSLKLGINEDPVFSSALGGKGRIPDEFIDLGEVNAGDVYLVRAMVIVPSDVQSLPALLRAGCAGRKRVFLNGQEIALAGGDTARVVRAEVSLKTGANRLELLVAMNAPGRLRMFYQFMPAGDVLPDPEWIWTDTPSDSGKTLFTKGVEAPGPVKSATMVVALGDLHQIRVNGGLVADQGNFDPYFTSRAERYDITQFVKEGMNQIEIEAKNIGGNTGLLLDGCIVLADGREIVFVSDTSFLTTPSGSASTEAAPAIILSGPARGYMGDPANLLLSPRPHPLPFGGWLQNQPAPAAPFDRVAYARSENAPAPGWYRFLLPPGATGIAIPARGAARLYVNGMETALTVNGEMMSGALPDPAAPRRVAALRIETSAGFEQGAALTAPITYVMGPGTIPLGSWDELGLPHYAGGLVYTADIPLTEPPAGKVILDLGRVRGCADVMVNGVSCGTKLWHPYRFNIASALQPGSNRIEMRVYNTLGPHFAAGHPSAHVYDNHTKSGIFGPIQVMVIPEIRFELSRK
ncbi:MAG TPA: hypothetical protein PLI09_07330 [Candidatus Hydrogenedentes bacterium]|nr:hypothetical protein [Candidatus Hydrogenedentota bacterium]